MQRNRGKQYNGKDQRDLFEKIRDTKGTFHAKMSTIKDANGKELTDTEDIKKRWQEQKNYTKKILMTRTTMMVWSLTKSQTSRNVKLSGLQKASLRTKLVEVMEFN